MYVAIVTSQVKVYYDFTAYSDSRDTILFTGMYFNVSDKIGEGSIIVTTVTVLYC